MIPTYISNTKRVYFLKKFEPCTILNYLSNVFRASRLHFNFCVIQIIPQEIMDGSMDALSLFLLNMKAIYAFKKNQIMFYVTNTAQEVDVLLST